MGKGQCLSPLFYNFFNDDKMINCWDSLQLCGKLEL